MIDGGDIENILGHIGDRGDNGAWTQFDFEVMDNEGEQTTITLDQQDLGDVSWDDLFDWIEDYCDEHDVDYDNEY